MATETATTGTHESPRFLGLFPELVYEPAVYNRYLLESDLQRIERYYRARGFHSALVREGLVRYLDPKHVSVDIHVQENAPTRIRQLTMRGLEGLPSDIAAAARAAAASAEPPPMPEAMGRRLSSRRSAPSIVPLSARRARAARRTRLCSSAARSSGRTPERLPA